ncbi:ATP-binding cassette domain-containing protein [Lactiplantibacillus paraplantarum]|uniref:ATP-binding cassette domain-containing protein n=1 Tax=Lactiplantibacillus paraplantarum TaxID=60520 RepID=UPI0021A5DBAD|nr:ATP-binding cassette domain-containing protein [Lactiplantibacillus paraplantarum]MCT4457003.1 ATP-binding cassette domain-containing protein [Lactiplantibacillus paraplantarum]
MHSLEIVNGEKHYDDYTVFNQINYSFEAGQTYALVGPSGGGKTTLLNSIGRLEDLSSGDIWLDNQNINTITILKYYREFIGYLFQNYALVDEENVQQNLNLVKRHTTDELSHQLTKYGLDTSYLKRKVYTLSGGEAQRVALTRLSLQDPLIILADEPTGALDGQNRELVLTSLREMANNGKLVIVATHDDYVSQWADNLLDISNFKQPNEN